MDTPLRIAIVGGGIAGLSLAVGIINHIGLGADIELQIYEQAPKFAEIGAGVAIGPNALKALDLLGLGDEMGMLCNAPKDMEHLWFDYRFAETNHPRQGELIHKITGTNAGKGSVHRAQFLDALIKVIPTKYCSFNHRFVDYTYDSQVGVTLKFIVDGSEKSTLADLVLACDGIKSPIRKTLYRHLGIEAVAPREKYAEWIAWRGIIPAEAYKKAMNREGGVPMMWLGLDRHILTFPVKRGSQVNIVGFVRDPENKKIDGQTAPWAEERPKSEMLTDFDGFAPECIDMLEAIEKPSVWGIFDLPALQVFDGEGIVLTGDAAHATTPHQGSGAGQAIEDALFLSRLVGYLGSCHALNREKINRALEIYGQKRHQRAARVQASSAEAGLLYEGRGSNGEGQDLEKVRDGLQGRMKWIWDYDIEGELVSMIEEVTGVVKR